MKLDKLYSLRNSFTVIGLTGRTGSGCSKIADTLSGDFDKLKSGIRDESAFNEDPIFARKYSICKRYLSHDNNWVPFEIIKYVNVLLFYILNKYGGDLEKTKALLIKNFKEDRSEDNLPIVDNLMVDIQKIHTEYQTVIKEITSFSDFEFLKEEEELARLNSVFFGPDFRHLTKRLFQAFEQYGYYRTRVFLHWSSCNIRGTGDPVDDTSIDIRNIYSIAILINRIIKAKKQANSNQALPTRIVIDSLRNSLEIMFFKERYSAFYMVAIKDVTGNSKDRLHSRLVPKISDGNERQSVLKKILQLDEIEYQTSDFAKGRFSSPDVENCIQKSDFHIFNLKKDQLESWNVGSTNGFFTREEQLMKLVSLIQQPGLITPSSAERAMQIANTAKLNSGCISRKVGAVVTDSKYFVLSVGWNDVAKGHTPCNLRNVSDFLENGDIDTNFHYSKFEKGNDVDSSSFKYKGEIPGNFKEAMVDYFDKAYKEKSSDLNGKNCSFCFKSVHNHYEGEANQVHTRSLHAEENAMLQITKLGGMGAEGGFLFTTASPCELCAKKAYQLGIDKVYFIDPYPGIAVDQILKGGNEKTQPKLIPFSGAIGQAYHKLYENFMAYKDEISMTLELTPKKKISKDFVNILNKVDDPALNLFLQKGELTDEQVKTIILAGVKSIS